MLFSFNAEAKKGVNIFAYSRLAPETAFYNKYGQRTTISDFKGDFVLLNFWSRHCVPCIKELDDLNNFVLKTKDTGIRVLIISKDDEWVSAREQKDLLEKYRAPDLDFYIDKGGKLACDFGIFAYPHTVLINKYTQSTFADISAFHLFQRVSDIRTNIRCFRKFFKIIPEHTRTQTHCH